MCLDSFIRFILIYQWVSDILSARLFNGYYVDRKDEMPTPHLSGYDRKLDLSRKGSQLQFFLPSEELGSAAVLYIALVHKYFNEGVPRPSEVTERLYNISTWLSECVFWDVRAMEWSGQGCTVSGSVSSSVMQCSCNHLTAFASRREALDLSVIIEPVERFFE